MRCLTVFDKTVVPLGCDGKLDIQVDPFTLRSVTTSWTRVALRLAVKSDGKTTGSQVVRKWRDGVRRLTGNVPPWKPPNLFRTPHGTPDTDTRAVAISPPWECAKVLPPNAEKITLTICNYLIFSPYLGSLITPLETT